MPGTPPDPRWWIIGPSVLMVGWLLPTGEAHADKIRLRGGGQLKGKLIEDKAHPDVLQFLGEVGKTPMVFKKDQVVQVIPEPSPLDEYVVLRQKQRTTAQAEFDLGTWAEDHHLADLAQVHFDAAVKLDSTFGPAHQKLGHVERNGRWLNADEVKEAQGLIKYRGRWITLEEKERKDAESATAAEGATWAKRIKGLRDAYVSAPPDRSLEAETRLLAIDDPVAVGPILRLLGNDQIPEVRSLAARVLGSIPTPSASTGLVGRLLGETDDLVRKATLIELARRDPAEVVPALVRALRSSQPEVVNRAAWGLGGLNAASTVPRLIPALITVEYRVVMVGDNGPSGNMGVNFNTVTPGYSNYGGGVSIPILTPPVVGPGVVAFGATSIPSTALNGSTFSSGGGGSRGPTPRIVPIEHQNAEVLAALEKMTGRNFGFDIATWKQWVATSFRIEAGPTRRVPQP